MSVFESRRRVINLLTILYLMSTVNCTQIRLHINVDKDHTLSTVEMGTYSSAGSFFGISGTRNYTYNMQGGNELTHSSVLAALHGFTNQTRPINKMVRTYSLLKLIIKNGSTNRVSILESGTSSRTCALTRSKSNDFKALVWSLIKIQYSVIFSKLANFINI